MRVLVNIAAVFLIVATSFGLGFLNKLQRFNTEPTLENRSVKKIPWTKTDWYKTDADGNILAAVGCKNALGVIQSKHSPAPVENPTNTAAQALAPVVHEPPKTNVNHLELAIQEGLVPVGFDQAQAATQDDLYVIIDARTEQEFKGGRLPRAVNIPYETATRESLGTLLGQLTEGFSLPTLVYCSDNFCPKAFELNRYLVELGHGSVELYAEGFQDWQNNGGEVEQ